MFDLPKLNTSSRPHGEDGLNRAKRELIIFIIGAALVVFIKIFIFTAYTMSGESMTNALQDKDVVWVEKISYHYSISRYDILILKTNEYGTVAKRVIALPGEKILIKNGEVYINDKEISKDEYGTEKIKEPGMAKNELILSEDEYFVLGDNRNYSSDSRVFGIVKKSQIKGKVIIRFYPITDITKFS